MNQIVVAIFDTETAALQGMHVLGDLHQEGGISLYASAVLVKDKVGNITVVQQNMKAPLGTALGTLVGGIVGIFGGPAAAAVGATLGGYGGLLADWANAGVDLAFMDDVGKTLSAGKAAVLAEVEESWTSLLDARLRAQGGTVFRRFRDDVVEDQLVRQSAALQASLQNLQDELDKANAEHRREIKKDIESTQQQLKATQDRAKARMDLTKAELELKTKALEDQGKIAGDRFKSRIEKRMAEARADFDMRSKKLSEAWALAARAHREAIAAP